MHAEKENKGKHGKAAMVLVLQLKKGLKQGQETYLAEFVEIHEGKNVEVLGPVTVVLKELRDIMLSELPKELPP